MHYSGYVTEENTTAGVVPKGSHQGESGPVGLSQGESGPVGLSQGESGPKGSRQTKTSPSSRAFPKLSSPEVTALEMAFHLAERAEEHGDVPVGAVVLTPDGIVAGLGLNQREIPPFDPSAHAEIVAMREAAGRLGTWNLEGCTLVVTLEPCTMCAGAIVNARISRLVFAGWDEAAGACGSLRDVVRDARLNHRVEVLGGVDTARSEVLLREFFARRRA